MKIKKYESKANTVIATRELSLEGDPSKKIKVEVFQPYLRADGLYRCDFSIEGAPKDLSNLHVGGADSYQAICLALSTISTIVDIFNREYCDSKLRWMGNENLDFHFSTELDTKV